MKKNGKESCSEMKSRTYGQAICPVCRKVFTRRSPQHTCCNAFCRERQNGRYLKEPMVCPMNDGVDCHGGDCAKCGWNPAVEKTRKEKLR